MPIKRWNAMKVLSGQLLVGGVAGLLTVACGSDSSSVSSITPEIPEAQEIAAVVEDEGTGLQITTRPVIYRPLVVNGNLATFEPGATFQFQGTGFSNVTSVTFLGGITAADDVEADFEIVSDNILEVTVPDDAVAGLIRVSTGFNAAYRLFLLTPPEPEPEPEPDIAVSPTSLDFGTVFVGFGSTREASISNEGDATLNINLIGFDTNQDTTTTPDSLDFDASGDGIPDFAVTSQPTFSLGAGVTGSLSVQCTPSEDGILTATLLVASNDPDENPVSVALTCVGDDQIPRYASSNPAPGGTINVGEVPFTVPGTTGTTTFTISEVGSNDLVVSNPQISGPDASDFGVVSPAFPLTILDGGSAQTVTVSCTPSSLGNLDATLTLDTNDPDQPTVSYTLDCMGTGPDFEAEPAPGDIASPSIISFGELAVFEQEARTIRIFNDGVGNGNPPGSTLLLNVGGGGVAQITGDTLNFFDITGFPVSSLAVGAESFLTIQCQPTQPTTGYTATLVIDNTNDPAQPAGGFVYTLECDGGEGLNS